MAKSFFAGKSVLVAGGAGFVGFNLTQRLLKLKAKVRATVHTNPPPIAYDAVDYVRCDLATAAGAKAPMCGVDYVFMCAANTSGAAVIEGNPLAHVTPNVLMNTLVLEEAYRAGVKKFLFISSNTVYPNVAYHVKEDDVTNDFYEKYFCVAWMKRFTEILCQMYAEKIKKPMKTVVVRPANIYGPFDDFAWETSHVLPALMRKALEHHEPLEVWGDGNDVKDFIYIDDLVDGLLLAMEKIDSYMPINIGTGRACSIKRALRAILSCAKYKDAKIVFNNSKPTMIPKRLIDVSLAKRILKFHAKTSIEEGVEKTIQWYRKQYKKQGLL